MIVAVADVYAQIPHRKAVQEVMLTTEVRVRADPGCVSFVFAEVLAEPGHFLLVERWRDQAGRLRSRHADDMNRAHAVDAVGSSFRLRAREPL
jgi:quinol monooxygenase YgiN